MGRILEAAGVNVTRTLRSAHDPEAGGPVIDLAGEDSGLLIGRRGQTLQALQFLVTLIVRKKLGEDVRVVLDVENYRQRRETSLRDMAAKVASRVAPDQPQHHAGTHAPRPTGASSILLLPSIREFARRAPEKAKTGK